MRPFKSGLPVKIAADAIQVGIDVYKGILVTAQGTPAVIVATAAAAAVLAVGAGLGYAVYEGARAVADKRPDGTNRGGDSTT